MRLRNKKAKIFNVKGLAKPAMATTLNPLTGLNSYFFSVVWTRDGSAISLSSVVIANAGTNNWKQLLSEVITENDGEITIPMGLFAPGTAIDIGFNVFPHQNIPASATFAVNHTGTTSQRLSPSSGGKALTKGKPWSDIVTVTLQ